MDLYVYLSVCPPVCACELLGLSNLQEAKKKKFTIGTILKM